MATISQRFKRIFYEGKAQNIDSDKSEVKTPHTSFTMPNSLHKSDAMVTPGMRSPADPMPSTPEIWEVNTDPGKRYQDIATSHMSEGPNPYRIPHPFHNRASGKLGDEISGTPSGTTGFKMGLSGNDAGGIGGAMYIPHTSIIRTAGHATGNMRTLDDGAQVPGVFVADPTRR